MAPSSCELTNQSLGQFSDHNNWYQSAGSPAIGIEFDLSSCSDSEISDEFEVNNGDQAEFDNPVRFDRCPVTGDDRGGTATYYDGEVIYFDRKLLAAELQVEYDSSSSAFTDGIQSSNVWQRFDSLEEYDYDGPEDSPTKYEYCDSSPKYDYCDPSDFPADLINEYGDTGDYEYSGDFSEILQDPAREQWARNDYGAQSKGYAPRDSSSVSASSGLNFYAPTTKFGLNDPVEEHHRGCPVRLESQAQWGHYSPAPVRGSGYHDAIPTQQSLVVGESSISQSDWEELIRKLEQIQEDSDRRREEYERRMEQIQEESNRRLKHIQEEFDRRREEWNQIRKKQCLETSSSEESFKTSKEVGKETEIAKEPSDCELRQDGMSTPTSGADSPSIVLTKPSTGNVSLTLSDKVKVLAESVKKDELDTFKSHGVNLVCIEKGNYGNFNTWKMNADSAGVVEHVVSRKCYDPGIIREYDESSCIEESINPVYDSDKSESVEYFDPGIENSGNVLLKVEDVSVLSDKEVEFLNVSHFSFAGNDEFDEMYVEPKVRIQSGCNLLSVNTLVLINVKWKSIHFGYIRECDRILKLMIDKRKGTGKPCELSLVRIKRFAISCDNVVIAESNLCFDPGIIVKLRSHGFGVHLTKEVELVKLDDLLSGEQDNFSEHLTVILAVENGPGMLFFKRVMSRYKDLVEEIWGGKSCVDDLEFFEVKFFLKWKADGDETGGLSVVGSENQVLELEDKLMIMGSGTIGSLDHEARIVWDLEQRMDAHNKEQKKLITDNVEESFKEREQGDQSQAVGVSVKWAENGVLYALKNLLAQSIWRSSLKKHERRHIISGNIPRDEQKLNGIFQMLNDESVISLIILVAGALGQILTWLCERKDRLFDRFSLHLMMVPGDGLQTIRKKHDRVATMMHHNFCFEFQPILATAQDKNAEIADEEMQKMQLKNLCCGPYFVVLINKRKCRKVYGESSTQWTFQLVWLCRTSIRAARKQKIRFADTSIIRKLIDAHFYLLFLEVCAKLIGEQSGNCSEVTNSSANTVKPNSSKLSLVLMLKIAYKIHEVMSAGLNLNSVGHALWRSRSYCTQALEFQKPWDKLATIFRGGTMIKTGLLLLVEKLGRSCNYLFVGLMQVQASVVMAEMVAVKGSVLA